MAHIIEIDDPADARLADFRDLSTADRRPDRPGGRGLVIAEGVVVVERLLASPYPVRAVFGVARRVEALQDQLAGITAPIYVTSAEIMAEVVGFHLNRGVLASADRAIMPTLAELAEGAQSVIVLEGVGDHENLGAIFRNAAALDIGGVVLGPGCADPLYRRAVRVSMGHVLRVPFAQISAWPQDLMRLQQQGFRLIALTPQATAVHLRTAIAGTHRIALMLGAEGPGLTEQALAAADVLARIPMARGVDSLNVATAAAVASYELGQARQVQY